MDDSSRNFRTTDIWRRPQTEELVDVHVYVVPSNGWIEQRKLAKRDIIDQAVSSGFVRVIPSTTLLELRSDIKEQLGFENLPEAFVFLRSVGRNFTQVKSKQELELKVKSFVPPCADEPEIYVKEGEYTIVRSASLGALSQITTLNNSDSPTVCSTSSDSQSDSRGESSLTSSSERQERRAFSLGRRTIPMSSTRAQPMRKPSQKTRSSRPPTPRVPDRLFVTPNSKHIRSSSKTSMKLNESIRESPREQVEEEIRVVSRTLNVESDFERINTPPPRPQSQSTRANNSNIQIPVPTPTPTPVDLGKNNEIDNSVSNNETDSLPEGHTIEDYRKNESPQAVAEANGSDDHENTSTDVISGEGVRDFNQEMGCCDCQCKETEDLPKKNEHNNSSEQCQLMLDNMHSKMEDEDVIVDPIKMLQGEGESLKNAEENGRDHYDEGFHSGELVASEEDSNSIETLRNFDTKDEDNFSKPIRAATPMPRSSSFYKSPEIKQLHKTCEEARAERRLRELKRDALMQKIRDLQRRKASSKDRGLVPAREEWRKRYQDVKKSTPRLEDHCGKLRQELEKLVKDMLVSVKTDSDSKPHRPSKKTSYKIMIMRHLQEVEDLRRRLQSVTIKLNAETKLRAQAEFEVKRLRQDLLHKKTQVTLTRKQTAFPQSSEMFFISAV